MLLDVDGLQDEPLIAAVDRTELVKKQLRDRKGRWVEMGAEAKRLLKDGSFVNGTVSGISGEYAELTDVKDPQGHPVANKMMVHYSELEMIDSKADLDDIGKPGPVTDAQPEAPSADKAADVPSAEPSNADLGFDKPADWKFVGELEDPNEMPSYVFDTPNGNRVVARMRASMYGETVSNPYDYAFAVYAGETDKPFDAKLDKSKHIGVAQFAGGVEALEAKHAGGDVPEALAEKYSNHISAQDQIELEHALVAVDQAMGENGLDIDDPAWEDAYAAIADLQDGMTEDAEISKANFAKQIDDAKDAVQQAAAALPEDSGDGDKFQHAYDLLKKANPNQPKARLNDGDAEPFDTSKIDNADAPGDAQAQADATADSADPVEPAYEHTPISDMAAEPDDNELESLKGYTRSGHDVINGIMRGVYDSDSNFSQKINAMKSLLEKGTLKQDTSLFRGADGAGWVEDLKAGDTFSDKGFLSTSLDEKIASDFSQDHQIQKPTLLELETPAGTHVIDVSAIQNKTDIDRMRNQIEKEAILPPDTEMSVSAVEKFTDNKGRESYRIKAKILAKDENGEPAATAEPDAGADTGPAPGGVPEANGLDQGPGNGEEGDPAAGPAGDTTGAVDVPFALKQDETVTDRRQLRALPIGSTVTAGTKSWTKISDDNGGIWQSAQNEHAKTPSAFLKQAGFGAATPWVSHVPEGGQYHTFAAADGQPLLGSEDVDDLPVGTQVSGDLPSIGKYTWTKGPNGTWLSDSPNFYDWDEDKLKTYVDKPASVFKIESLGNGEGPAAGIPDIDETPNTDLSSPITGQEIASVQHFTDKGSEWINQSMRKDEKHVNAKNAASAAGLESALEKSTLSHDTVLYRGMAMRDDVVPGAIVTDKGFMSTTTDENVANTVAQKQAFGSSGVLVLEIDTPAGTHAIDVNGIGGSPKHEHENEFILANGTSLQIDSVEMINPGDESKFVGPTYRAKARVVSGDAATDTPEPVDDTGLMEAAVADNGGLVDTSSWTKTGGPQGSNAGGFYTAPDGKKYYLKESKTPEHAKNEVLADNLYKLAGIDTSDLKLADVGDGKIGTVSEILDGGKTDLSTKRHDEAYRKKLQEGFAVDAWLSNWDVAGTGFDNVMTDKDGNPVRIDPGGALLYRAMGSPKGGAFGDSVGEWDSLRDGSNHWSEAIFGDITPDALKASAQRVAAITPEQIDGEVDKLDFDPDTAQKLKDTLKARREDVVKRAGIDESSAETAAEETVTEAPSSKSFSVLSDPGKSGDGYFNAPGTHFWGKYGAAGVMIEHTDPATGEKKYLLVQRGPMVSSNKGKWQLPGGALDSNENDYQGTAREVQEELGASNDYLAGLKPKGEVVFNHESGWHYTNIAAQADEQFEPKVDGTETGDAGWFTKEEIANLPLHPALEQNLDAIFGEFDKPQDDDTSLGEALSDTVTPEDAPETPDVAPSGPPVFPTDDELTDTSKFTRSDIATGGDLENAPVGSVVDPGTGAFWIKKADGEWESDGGSTDQEKFNDSVDHAFSKDLYVPATSGQESSLTNGHDDPTVKLISDAVEGWEPAQGELPKQTQNLVDQAWNDWDAANTDKVATEQDAEQLYQTLAEALTTGYAQLDHNNFDSDAEYHDAGAALESLQQHVNNVGGLVEKSFPGLNEPNSHRPLPDVPLAEGVVLDHKSQVDALPSGSQLMWSNGVNPDTIFTKDKNGVWREPNGLEVTDGDLGESLFNGELTVHKLGDQNAPERPPAPKNTPEDPTSSVPVVGFKEFGTDANGAKYVSTPDGQHIMVGTAVKSKTDGLEGTVKALEGNGEYVKVVGPDGKVKGRKIATLDVTGGEQPVVGNAPEAPSEASAPNTEQPFGYAVGEKVFDSSDLAEFPEGSVIEADGQSYKKNDDGMWEQLYADGTTDKWSSALPDSSFGDHVDNPTVKQIGERPKSADTPSQPEPEQLADWEAELLGYVTSPQTLKDAPVGSTVQVKNSKGETQRFKKVSSDGWWLDGQQPPADMTAGMPSHLFDGSVENHQVRHLTHPAEPSGETFDSAGSVNPDGTVEMAAPEGTLPDVPHTTVGLDANGNKYVMAGDGKPMMVGTTVKSDKDGLEGTVVQVENNGTHVKVQDASGKKYGRAIKTLSVTGGESPKPHAVEAQPAPEPEPVNVPEPEPAASDDEWFMGRVIEDYNHDSLKEAPEGTVVADKDGDFWKKIGDGEDWAYKSKNGAWDNGGNGTPSKVWGPFKVVEDPAPETPDLTEDTPPAPAALAPGDKITNIDDMHGLPVGSVVTGPYGGWKKTGADEWVSENHPNGKHIAQDFTADGTEIKVGMMVKSVGQDTSSAAPAPTPAADTNVHFVSDLNNLPIGTVIKAGNSSHYIKHRDGTWRAHNPENGWVGDFKANPVNILNKGQIQGSGVHVVQSPNAPTTTEQTPTPAVPTEADKTIPGVQLLGSNGIAFKKGDQVTHPKFGTGKVVTIENNGTHAKVVFEGTGGKKQGISGLKLTKVGGSQAPAAAPTQSKYSPGDKVDSISTLDDLPAGTKISYANSNDPYDYEKQDDGKWKPASGGPYVYPSTDFAGSIAGGTYTIAEIGGPAHVNNADPIKPSEFVPAPVDYTAPKANLGDFKPDESSPWFEQPKPELPAKETAGVEPWVPDDWMERAGAHYAEIKNGKSVQQSSYFNFYNDVVNNGNVDSLNKLNKSLLTQELYDEALTQINAVKAKNAEAEVEYGKLLTKHQQDVKDWETANGLVPDDFTPEIQLSDTPFTGGDADWSKAHYSTPAALDVLDGVKSSTKLSRRGASFAADSDDIEDFDVRVFRNLDVNGHLQTEFKFKLTAKKGDELASKFESMGFSKTAGISYKGMAEDPDTGLKKYTQNNAYTTTGATFSYIDPETEVKIEVYQSSTKASNNISPVHNTVRVFAPEDADITDIQSALTKLSIEATPASEADIRIYAENKMISILGGRTDSVHILSSSSARQKILDEIKTKYGITLGDLKYSTDSNGRMKVFLSDAARDALIEKTGVKGFTHSFSGSHEVDRWENMLSGAVRGLMPTNTRWSEGVQTSGMSSVSDMQNSGGDYIFTSVLKSTPTIASYGGSVVMHPQAAMRRLDYYANAGDSYGSRSTNGKPIEQLAGHPHETLFKHGIPVSDMWYVTVEDGVRELLIERLKKKGITQINGIPLENFILTSGDVVPQYAPTQWSTDDLPPAVTV